MPPLRGQILHKPHGLKLKAGQLSKGNGMGVGKGGGGALLPKKKGMHAQLAKATAVCYSSTAGVRISLSHL